MDSKFGLVEYRCLRCSHHWQLKKPVKPLECPKCRSKYWNIPKKAKNTGKDILTEEIDSILLRKSKDMTAIAKQLEELELDNAIKHIKTSLKKRDWEQMEYSIKLLDKAIERLRGWIKSVKG